MTNLMWCIYLITIYLMVFQHNLIYASRKYAKEDILKLREEVREMFNHAYSGYLKYAFPYDELRPLTCDGVDTWGSYSLTLIDALDTLAVMGNYSEFRRVVDIVTSKANFDANINVSVFETNIRIVGGLLSAHLLSQRAGVELEPGWPCNGPLLRLAEDVAKRLLAAFDTPTGMPYGTVNLRHGVPPGETSITCTAGVGTFILEFGTLSRLTGDPVYEEVALNALYALYHHRSSIGLYGNHIDVATGRWTAQDSGIGAGVDSYLEYLVKGALLVQRPELMAIFNEGRAAIDKHLKRNDWYLWVSMHKGQVTLPVFQSLEAYWPGVLSLIGDISGGMKSMHNYHQVWKQYGFTPEFYNIVQGQVGTNRESYPLRPELIESTMYLYRATNDPFLLEIGTDILRSIQHSSRTKCGYATIKDCRDHSLENRMESFFLAETTKYLYLLFDPDNFIHNDGQHGRVHTLPSGQECILDAGGYVFNTEAHPLDPGALLCCSENYNEPKRFNRATARGEKLTSFLNRNNKLPKAIRTEPSQPLDRNDIMHRGDLSSAFASDEESTSQEAQKFLDRSEQNEALDILNVPPPTDGDVQPIGDALGSKPMSLNMLQMIEVLMDFNLQESLTKTAWSHDLLVELVEVIENAEKTLAQETQTTSDVPDNSKENTDLKDANEPDVENYNPKTGSLGSTTKNKSTVVPGSVAMAEKDSVFGKSNHNNSSELITKSGKIKTSKQELRRKQNLNENSSIPPLLNHQESKTPNQQPDESRERKEERKENSLFKIVISQQFKTIKETILTETELVNFHLNKCNENLELTRNLVGVTNDHDIRSQFFTKKAEVMILAMELKLSLQETKELLNSQESGESVTLDVFKKLIKLVVDRKTIKMFIQKYNEFVSVTKKLIEIGKSNYKLHEPSIDTLVQSEAMDNNENDMNDSEELTNRFKTEDEEESKSAFQTDEWKADDASYQVDDKERVSLASKVENGPLFTDKVRLKTEAVIGLLPKSLVSSGRPFNAQLLLERIRENSKYFRNTTWSTQHDLLTCMPQPYFTRIMLSGEFFND